MESHNSTRPNVRCCTFVGSLCFIILAQIYACDRCDSQATLFLAINGILGVCIAYIGALTEDDFVMGLLSCIDLATVIWGSITVFKSHSDWQHTLPLSDGFCPQIPHLVAFVYLIGTWIAVGLVLVGGICLCIGAFCVAVVRASER